MRKNAKLACILIILIFLQTTSASAAELKEIKTTAYYQGTTTATGKQVRKGYAAVAREHIGETVAVYKRNEDGTVGDFLGYWECEDTGTGADPDGDGVGAITMGYVIDIYEPTLEECKEWMEETQGQVFIQYIPAEG